MSHLAVDLALIGRRLLASFEGCACEGCQLLDRRMDADAAAVHGERLELVSYRDQRGQYEYETLTIRWMSDRGNSRVQAQKILDGQSRADLYINAFNGWIVWAEAGAVRSSLLQPTWRCGHALPLSGRNGQQFVVMCVECCDLTVTQRPPEAAAA